MAGMVFFDPEIGGDGSTVTDDADPHTGLRNYGWVTRFVPCFTNQVAIANWIKARAEYSGSVLEAVQALHDQTVEDATAIKDAAVSETTAIKDAAITETGAIRDEAQNAAAAAERSAQAAQSAPATVGAQVQRLHEAASDSKFTRDAAGRVDTVTETLSGGMRTITLIRGAGDLLQQTVTVAGGVTRTETFNRDGDGNVTSITATEV